MNCPHIPTSTVMSVTCWGPPAEERKLPGPALSSMPSTMPRGWPLWLAWSGLRRCCSPRRASTSLLLEKHENGLDGKYLAWYIMLDSAPLGPSSDHLCERRLPQGRNTRPHHVGYGFLFRSYAPEKLNINQILWIISFRGQEEAEGALRSWEKETSTCESFVSRKFFYLLYL